MGTILKYLIATTELLASLMIFAGLVLSFSRHGESRFSRLISRIGITVGIACGFVVFGIRKLDPKGMNIALMRYNRRLLVVIAVAAVIALLIMLVRLILKPRKKRDIAAAALSLVAALAFTYIIPSVLQFTQEFIYFGEAGISTKAMMRALGFSIGVGSACLLMLFTYKTVSAAGEKARDVFVSLSVAILAGRFFVMGVAALQRLRVIPLTERVFAIMVWGDEFSKLFLFSQTGLAIILALYIIFTHLHEKGDFANKALRRKEKARLRTCRRWSSALIAFSLWAAFTMSVLHYYETLPPAVLPAETFELKENIIRIELENVADGHLHKFTYHTPNGYDVDFLVVKKPIGTSYGVGLDACEICGKAGYYERGDEEVICRRCDVVMNKNTIGFKGGCNPIPFPYEIKDGSLYIDVRSLIKHEKRFR